MKPVSLSDLPALAAYAGKTVIIYDGECPFCSRFVQWQRLKESVGPVHMFDAREAGDLSTALWDAGYDLNEGMALIWNDQVFHGDDCVNRLALLSSGSGAFNMLNAWVFKSPRISALLYPILRLGRNTLLRLLGRRKISQG
ncbi:MAG: DCC1-like thiol-disulfide oxidoreductase family protein [Thalassovita sp.]